MITAISLLIAVPDRWDAKERMEEEYWVGNVDATVINRDYAAPPTTIFDHLDEAR